MANLMLAIAFTAAYNAGFVDGVRTRSLGKVGYVPRRSAPSVQKPKRGRPRKAAAA